MVVAAKPVELGMIDLAGKPINIQAPLPCPYSHSESGIFEGQAPVSLTLRIFTWN